MKDEYPPKAVQAVEQAAKAIKKHFKAATDLGMHPDEFWFLLGQEIQPGRTMRPRSVSRAASGKKRRAAKGRRARQDKNFQRNQNIRAMFALSLKEGEPLKSIYRRAQKLYRRKERQLRNIVRHEIAAFRNKVRV
jgi:hypothetical protein